MDELNQLVKEYNAAESQQEARLRRIFELLAARKDYRRVQFGSGANPGVDAWSNCFDNTLPGAIDNLVLRNLRWITDVSTGNE